MACSSAMAAAASAFWRRVGSKTGVVQAPMRFPGGA